MIDLAEVNEAERERILSRESGVDTNEQHCLDNSYGARTNLETPFEGAAHNHRVSNAVQEHIDQAELDDDDDYDLFIPENVIKKVSAKQLQE